MEDRDDDDDKLARLSKTTDQADDVMDFFSKYNPRNVSAAVWVCIKISLGVIIYRALGRVPSRLPAIIFQLTLQLHQLYSTHSVWFRILYRSENMWNRQREAKENDENRFPSFSAARGAYDGIRA